MDITSSQTYKKVPRIGPGGYLCPCCGPAKKDRDRFGRMVKRHDRDVLRKQIAKELWDASEES